MQNPPETCAITAWLAADKPLVKSCLHLRMRRLLELWVSWDFEDGQLMELWLFKIFDRLAFYSQTDLYGICTASEGGG